MFSKLRGPERLFRIGQWIIALLFAFFLIQIGAKLIEDLPKVSSTPTLEQFLNQDALNKIKQEIQPNEQELQKLQERIDAQKSLIDQAQSDYDHSKSSFQNWLQTRSITEQSSQNQEVIARTRALDQKLHTKQILEQSLFTLESNHQALEKKRQPSQKKIAEIQNQAYEQLDAALRIKALKDFALRLILVLPILIISVRLFQKHRHSQHWPFVWGFVFFAAFAFFFELVPYLPSFGGYVRYGVGALLTFFVGRSLIQGLQKYLERKQEEQKVPQEERKQEIRYEKALESVAKKQCPSCERSFNVSEEHQHIDFCMHCGLKLFAKCTHCGLRKNSFFHFCPSCGSPSES